MDVRDLAEIGRLVSATAVTGAAEVGPDVVIDSRLATPGSLFVALPGERVDGHDFVAAAAENGAAAAIVRHEVAAQVPQVVVDDPHAALTALAQGIVAEATNLHVVGITGSSGKTSTKDLLAQVLEAAGPTVAPQGSFNNEIGVPLTATRVDSGTRFLVSEMGARGKGHIAWLCRIVTPDVGVVVNVGHAHLGEFGSVEAIAEAKGELVEALPAEGWAVLTADDRLVAGMATRTKARIAWTSVAGRPEREGPLLVWARDVQAGAGERYSFRLHAERDGQVAEAPVTLQVAGRHNVANALAAAGSALALDVPLDVVAASLGSATNRSRWRMEIHERKDGVLVVNDAYNANPDSMQAAFDTVANLLADRRHTYPDAHLFAVLGDMLELGATSVEQHTAVGKAAAAAGVSTLVAIGDHADDIVAGAKRVDAVRAADRDEALSILQGIRPGDIVLVKASRGIGLEKVADGLLEERA